jgi:tRNA U38,U39,U40 pseudouridine synthase TruA
MWLITATGFYSIVQKPGDSKLTIRSRVKKDLEALQKTYLPDMGKIANSDETDYRYRARVSHADLASAVARMVGDIDYANFKSSVAKTQDYQRVHIYSAVWEDLRTLADEDGKN